VFLLDVGGDTLGDAQDNAHAATAWTHAVSATADALLLPLVGHTVRDLDHHTLPERIAGVTLTGIGLEASAITLAQQHDGVILRAVNLTAHPTRGTWQLPHEGPWQVTRCRLDETPLGDPAASGARVEFQAGPREIVTVLITTA
jgi:alpha-mannosidase